MFPVSGSRGERDADLLRRWCSRRHHRSPRPAPEALRHLRGVHPSLSWEGAPTCASVGRDVGVRYVLSGSVRRASDRLRVSAELAETARGTVVWASHFDGISEDLFALQDQIATRVVSTIAPQVREAELRRALRKRPDSMEAYDCVLRGLAQRLPPQSRGLRRGTHLAGTRDRPRSGLCRAVRPARRLAQHSRQSGLVARSGRGQRGGDSAWPPPPSSATASTRWPWPSAAT